MITVISWFVQEPWKFQDLVVEGALTVISRNIQNYKVCLCPLSYYHMKCSFDTGTYSYSSLFLLTPSSHFHICIKTLQQ